jgi:hypothetical protein
MKETEVKANAQLLLPIEGLTGRVKMKKFSMGQAG